MLLNVSVTELHLKHFEKTLVDELCFSIFKVDYRFLKVLKDIVELLLNTGHFVILLQYFFHARWIKVQEERKNYDEKYNLAHKTSKSVKVRIPVGRAMEGNSADCNLEENLESDEDVIAPMVGKVVLLSHHEQVCTYQLLTCQGVPLSHLTSFFFCALFRLAERLRLGLLEVGQSYDLPGG